MRIEQLLQNPKYTQKRVLENLICLVLDIKREQLRLQLEEVLTEVQEQKILEYYRQYVEEKRPLDYILGYVEFLNNRFFLDERSLIPRPETEYMIQAVNEEVALSSGGFAEGSTTHQDSSLSLGMTENASTILIDVGTGSGVLGLSVLLHNPDFFQQAYLLDYSRDALQLAQKNYEHHKENFSTAVQLQHSDLLTGIVDENKINNGDQIILLANLPYIPDEMFEQNVGDGVKNWEPKMAFVGGDDGLDFYRRMFQQIFDEKEKKDFDLAMFLEMMTWQVEILEKEFGEKLSFEEVKTFHFNIRIVKCVVK
ncbi:MAG: hypothetical protein CR971_00960 [candidate division SR1 bacterium]|nr:MAG: hypothetical protein CR971_00960 [candidate division SR1 bacterium]